VTDAIPQQLFYIILCIFGVNGTAGPKVTFENSKNTKAWKPFSARSLAMAAFNEPRLLVSGVEMAMHD